MNPFRSDSQAEEVEITSDGTSVSIDKETGILTLRAGKSGTIENLSVTGTVDNLSISVKDGGKLKNVHIGGGGNISIDGSSTLENVYIGPTRNEINTIPKGKVSAITAYFIFLTMFIAFVLYAVILLIYHLHQWNAPLP